MNILGLNCFGHDSACAVIKDNKLIAAVEQERFDRKVHSGAFPKEAMEFCLREAGIAFDAIEHVGFYFRPWLGFTKRAVYVLKNFPEALGFLARKNQMFQAGSVLTLKRNLARTFKRKKLDFKLHFIEHHLAHAASSFLVSPFEEAAILSVDGTGEWNTTLFAIGKGNKIEKIKAVDFPNSIGYLYGAVSEYLGFRICRDEGKVMGLASYGDPWRYYKDFKDIIKLRDKGEFIIDTSYFDYHLKHSSGNFISKKFIEKFGPRRVPESKIERRHEDIAAALQKITEEAVIHLARYLREETREKYICLAGGVGLNCVANGRLLENTDFKEMFIQPASAESGTSLGSALYINHCLLHNRREYVMEDAYLGPSFNNKQIKECLDTAGMKYTYFDNIEEMAAKKLADGNVMGWFQGRMEWGPRALGNRSILADPRRQDMKDVVNIKVKHREVFRPFAPSVLEEKQRVYFEQIYPSPFMLSACQVVEDKKRIIPSVTHVDGSARLHSVSKKTNQRFYFLLKEFEKLTGVPVLLNTSFNVRGEPIVCKPQEAVSIFKSTALDVLVLGNYMLIK